MIIITTMRICNSSRHSALIHSSMFVFKKRKKKLLLWWYSQEIECTAHVPGVSSSHWIGKCFSSYKSECFDLNALWTNSLAFELNGEKKEFWKQSGKKNERKKLLFEYHPRDTFYSQFLYTKSTAIVSWKDFLLLKVNEFGSVCWIWLFCAHTHMNFIRTEVMN